jgi:hypothetical protein
MHYLSFKLISKDPLLNLIKNVQSSDTVKNYANTIGSQVIFLIIDYSICHVWVTQ